MFETLKRTALQRATARTNRTETEAPKAAAIPGEEPGELLYFYLNGCPHCMLATGILNRLLKEPRYAPIHVTMIEERKEKRLADSYDYWFVPTFFYGEEKLHEGHAEEADLRRVLDGVLARLEETEDRQTLNEIP